MIHITEKDIEKYLVDEAKKIGALVRKCQWVGHNHCPDRIIMHPIFTCWVEVKAPRQKPRAGQQREHERMEKHGQHVFICDSYDMVDNIVNYIKHKEQLWNA